MTNIYIASLNVNDDRRAYPGTPLHPAFADLSFQKRFSLTTQLLDSLSEHDETIFALQEANDGARDQLKTFFEAKKLTVLTTKYANDSGAFNFVFAFNNNFFELKETFQLYYTETGLSTTPDERQALTKEAKIKRHLGTEYEKSVQFVRLLDKRSGKEFLVANTHPGLEMAHRLAAMAKLCDALKDEQGTIIAVGDFNQFDSSVAEPTVYREQVKILTDNKFHWASEGLMHVGMKTTFMGFPYDVLRFFNQKDHEEYKSLLSNPANFPSLRQFFSDKIKEKNISLFGGCLDSVFTRGLLEPTQAVSVRSFTMFKGKRVETSAYDQPKALQEQFIQHFDEHSKADEADAPTNSDHFALMTTVSF